MLSRSSELAIVALKRSWRQIFRWKTERPAKKTKWPGFAVTTAAQDSRAVGTAWHQSHRTIDPQCLKKSPPRRGGINALTENVALHFTLNQDTPSVSAEDSSGSSRFRGWLVGSAEPESSERPMTPRKHAAVSSS